MKQLWRKFVGQWAFSDSDFVIFAPNKQTEKHGKHCLKILIEIKILIEEKILIEIKILIKPCQQVTLAVCILQLAYMCPVQLSFNPMGCPWDFPGKNAVGGCHLLLQGIFLTQESNLRLLLRLLHCGLVLYPWATREALTWKGVKF